MNPLIHSTTLLLICLLTTVPVRADVTRYSGLCDASAAVALDEQHFVVADDDHDFLTIYRRGKPDPVHGLDLSEYLGNREVDGKLREADLEGAARIGNRIYWITSHGRNSKGKHQEARQRFFATDLVDTGSGQRLKTPTSPPYTRLIEELLADPRFAVLARAHALKIPPEAPGGFNIEGLAATPGGQLLIGFRNPLADGKALLVPLNNPAEVVDATARPLFGDLVVLDLGGRGVRSIELLNGGYLIVAGPYDNGKQSGKDFALYHWSGKADASPQRVGEANFGKLHPEAMFAFPGSNGTYLLSDDGDEKVGGRACKDKEVPSGKKSFRGISLRMPALNNPP